MDWSIGIDEVGRGCLAGPMLVVAARQRGELPVGLKDSKLLTRKEREEIFVRLATCCSFGEGWVSAEEIDSLGLTAATKAGVQRALKAIAARVDEKLIIDGHINYAPKSFRYVTAMIDGDNLVPLVSAASVYAKVTRDRYMCGLAEKYPAYGFDRNVGYGTPLHRQALRSFGLIDSLHRKSFGLLKDLA